MVKKYKETVMEDHRRLVELYEKSGEPMHSRMLEVTADSYGCTRDKSAGWSSVVEINPDTKEPWCGTDADTGNNWCYCICENGYIWDVDETFCHPTHWEAEVVNPNIEAVNSYFDKLTDKYIEDSIYVKNSDSLLDAFPLLVKRECELLYNKKNNITLVDEIHDPTSMKSRFLGGWGLLEEVADGAANDPCDGIVGGR